jgi:predicted peroxiredoxin
MLAAHMGEETAIFVEEGGIHVIKKNILRSIEKDLTNGDHIEKTIRCHV